jgi:hypothetical protein
MSGGAVVFAGPTICSAEVVGLVACVCLPPARQGDVWRAVRAHNPAVIGLIDGVFLDQAAVWHREILWALAQGVHVYGAASMGALRAAELAAFGMRGVGRIFAAYREGIWPGFPEPFEDDDEVAVVHAPSEAGGAALSDAMVDIRATLLSAEADHVIDRQTCLSLAAAMKRLHFPERSRVRLADQAPATLRDWLKAGFVPQKHLDALALLGAVAAHQAAPQAPFEPQFRFERALVWERFEAQALKAERDARGHELARRRGDTNLLRREDIDAWLR